MLLQGNIFSAGSLEATQPTLPSYLREVNGLHTNYG